MKQKKKTKKEKENGKKNSAYSSLFQPTFWNQRYWINVLCGLKV